MTLHKYSNYRIFYALEVFLQNAAHDASCCIACNIRGTNSRDRRIFNVKSDLLNLDELLNATVSYKERISERGKIEIAIHRERKIRGISEFLDPGLGSQGVSHEDTGAPWQGGKCELGVVYFFIFFSREVNQQRYMHMWPHMCMYTYIHIRPNRTGGGWRVNDRTMSPVWCTRMLYDDSIYTPRGKDGSVALSMHRKSTKGSDFFHHTRMYIHIYVDIYKESEREEKSCTVAWFDSSDWWIDIYIHDVCISNDDNDIRVILRKHELWLHVFSLSDGTPWIFLILLLVSFTIRTYYV